MLQRLDFYKVDYIKENKYEYIPLDVKVPTDSNGSYYSPNIYVNVDNKNILNTDYDYENEYDSTFNYKIHLIPKKMGTTNIDITFKDNNANVLESYKYSISIDKELNVKFEEIK